MITKVKAGDVENLEIFLGHNGDVIGVCFTKDDCEYSFDEATFFNEEKEMLDGGDGFFDAETALKIHMGHTALVAY